VRFAAKSVRNSAQCYAVREVDGGITNQVKPMMQDQLTLEGMSEFCRVEGLND
jgi:hypothetical protein